MDGERYLFEGSLYRLHARRWFKGVRRMHSYHRFRQPIGSWHFENTLCCTRSSNLTLLRILQFNRYVAFCAKMHEYGQFYSVQGLISRRGGIGRLELRLQEHWRHVSYKANAVFKAGRIFFRRQDPAGGRLKFKPPTHKY